MDLGRGHGVFSDLVGIRGEQFTGCAHPAGKCGAIQIDAIASIASVDLRLPIKGLVITIFGNQHMCQKVRTWQAKLDRSCRRRRFHYAVATGGAGELGPHMPNRLAAGRNPLQLGG
jgi:hypothetical protein